MSSDFVARNCTLVGRRLQEERKALGYTSQESLVLQIGRAKRTITNWETGASYPDASDLLTLAALGFDVSYILFGVRAPPKIEQNVAQYETPARQLAAEVSGMQLSSEDADAVATVARRLNNRR